MNKCVPYAIVVAKMMLNPQLLGTQYLNPAYAIQLEVKKFTNANRADIFDGGVTMEFARAAIEKEELRLYPDLENVDGIGLFIVKNHCLVVCPDTEDNR